MFCNRTSARHAQQAQRVLDALRSPLGSPRCPNQAQVGCLRSSKCTNKLQATDPTNKAYMPRPKGPHQYQYLRNGLTYYTNLATKTYGCRTSTNLNRTQTKKTHTPPITRTNNGGPNTPPLQPSPLPGRIIIQHQHQCISISASTRTSQRIGPPHTPTRAQWPSDRNTPRQARGQQRDHHQLLRRPTRRARR